jgi:hypothetical protein
VFIYHVFMAYFNELCDLLCIDCEVRKCKRGKKVSTYLVLVKKDVHRLASVGSELHSRRKIERIEIRADRR